MNTKIYDTLNDFFEAFIKYMECVSDNDKIIKEARVLFIKMSTEHETARYMNLGQNLENERLTMWFEINFKLVDDTSKEIIKVLKYFKEKYSDRKYGHLILELL